MQVSVGPSEYVGAIATDTEFSGRSNRVAGADFSKRLTPTQRIEGFVLGSRTQARGTSAQEGVGSTLSYNYSTRAMAAQGAVEHYSRGFQMDSAFLNRVGLTSGWAYLDHNFYPGSGPFAWVRRISPFVFAQGGTDRNAGGREQLEVTGVRFNFTRLGFLRVDRSWGFEHWAGQRFERGNVRVWGNVQIFRWLKLDGRYEGGRAVFYDPAAPLAGERQRLNGGFVLQPNGQFSQSVSVDRVSFDRRDTSARLYTVDIVNSKTTWQFTRQLFLRGLVQYDSSRHRVLTDTLLSFELRPGSVFYVGYGSLIERRAFEDGRWSVGAGAFQQSQRGFFTKVSYLFRL